MPLTFTVTREDMLRGKIVEPGWYKTLVKNVSQEAASTDGSTNTIIDLVITEGPHKDVPLRRYFSEKAPGFALPFLNAVGAPIGVEGGTIDMEKAKGKIILTYVANGMYNNKPTNQAEDFRPLTGSTQGVVSAPLAAPTA